MSESALNPPAVLKLLRHSLSVWRVDGGNVDTVSRPGQHEIRFEIRSAGDAGWIEVEPFAVRTETGGDLARWRIRTRHANDAENQGPQRPEQTVNSLRGLLREVRRLLDPDYVPYRAVIGFDPTRAGHSYDPPPSPKDKQP